MAAAQGRCRSRRSAKRRRGATSAETRRPSAALQASPLYREYGAICNWLAESDDISDFAQLAHDYRLRIGIDAFPETGEDYLRALLDLARQTFGMP